ncbi:MFS transporter [Georgenia sp. TF02-10]|uniref:MFS transporter n=1 Tax=Georgenia sp. TF02-10 TaxID=2917725 RepID=UPI001FA7C50D|nr:MFS transporter [Georgenia sp. TF02-10]UNX53494.1 MFS transporter [Georgenia sp. TF02-10]
MHAPDQAAAEAAAAPDPRRWRTLALLGVAQLMLIVDVTVVAIALPDMGADLGLDRAGLTWVASSYALVFGGLMLLGGKTADILGPRRVVLAGLTVFVAASLLAGLATTGAAMLLLARALQGVGAAAMSPAALSVIARTFTGAELSRALGVWSALGGAGAAVGVLLGGVLTSGPGWPWVFYVNVPVGAVLLIGLIRSVRPLPGSGGRLDVPGAALVTLATGAVVYGLVAAGDHGWLSADTLVAVVVGLVGYVLFAVRIRAAAAPLVDPALLRRRPVLRGLGLIFVATALMISVFFLGSFVLQQLHGFTALETGLSFLPVAVGTILGSSLAGRVLPRWGVRTVSVAGLLVAAAGLAAAAGIFSMTVLVLATSVAGFGIGAAFVAAAGSLFSAVQPQEAGVGSGALSTFHEFGAATGVSAVSSVAAAALLDPGFAAFAPGYWFAAAVALVAGLASLAPLRGTR